MARTGHRQKQQKQMQPSDDGKWELPERLRITDPDVLAQSEQMRADLSKRAQSPFAHLTPQEAERHNAAIMATHLEGERQHLNELKGMALTVGRVDIDVLTEAHKAISARLAEAYATLGRFDLAAEVDPRPEHRAEHIEILEAINRPDGEWDCQCAPGKDFIKRDIVTPDGQGKILRACSGCGELNVVPISKHLSEQRGHRQKARTMTAGMNKEDATLRLQASGHTHAKLIKA